MLSRRSTIVVPTGSEPGSAYAHPGSINVDKIDEWHEDLEGDKQYALAKTILSRTNMNIVLKSREASISDQMLFNHRVSIEGEPVANQLASGRCWLFATCNVTRIFTSRKYNLGEFQLSQSYLFFYDHLSKANWFLEQCIDLSEEPLDSRVMQYAMSNMPAQDGGQWDLAVSLVEEFGLVPQTVYPESWNSSNSGALDALLTSKLREMGLQLRAVMHKNSQLRRKEAVAAAREVKDRMLKKIYRILTITCGTPPKPDQQFLWEYKDKAGKVRSLRTTPLEFAQVHAGYNCSDTVSLINDPRHPYKQVYTVERLGNVVGGRPVRYLNLPSEALKQIAIEMIKADYPVWFGCDVDKASDTAHGIMDVRLFDYDDAFGTRLNMDKRQRMLAQDSSMTHAMMFTGVHLDEHGEPVRWRVENSWGPDACNTGFLVMTDAWFTEYLFQIVAPRKFVSQELLNVYDQGKVTPLPPWDVLEKDAPFVLQDVELLEPEAEEVLIEVVACGICHTDLCIQNGAFPSPFPNVTGHETSGIVVKVGSGVKKDLKAGDKVLCSFNYCSSCKPCRTGHPAACEGFAAINFGRQRSTAVGNKAGIRGPDGEEVYGAFFGQSGFAKHAVVVENSVVKVADDADLTTLAPIGCGFQTGAGALLNRLKPAKNSSLAISGLGAVGAGALFAAKYLGVETIVLLDVVPGKLEMARTFGATHTFNARDADVVEQVRKLTEGGVDYFVECSGNVHALKAGWEMTANLGTLLSCGTPGPGVNPPFGIFENLTTCKTYIGLCEGDSNPPEFVPFLAKLYAEGHFPIDKISKTFAYDKLDDAVHAMHTGEVIKPIVVFKQT
ncbi:bleomycin hydrolase [Rhodotorula kratochvilovae]